MPWIHEAQIYDKKTKTKKIIIGITKYQWNDDETILEMWKGDDMVHSVPKGSSKVRGKAVWVD